MILTSAQSLYHRNALAWKKACCGAATGGTSSRQGLLPDAKPPGRRYGVIIPQIAAQTRFLSLLTGGDPKIPDGISPR